MANTSSVFKNDELLTAQNVNKNNSQYDKNKKGATFTVQNNEDENYE